MNENYISPEAVEELIDFSGGKENLKNLGEGQLKACTAIYNKLVKNNFAYLGDEVGMGKTYIALGVVGLLRHFNPRLKVLYIAPKRNIQYKWIKEYNNFIRYNYRNIDGAVKNYNQSTSSPYVACENLYHLAQSFTQAYYGDYLL